MTSPRSRRRWVVGWITYYFCNVDVQVLVVVLDGRSTHPVY